MSSIHHVFRLFYTNVKAPYCLHTPFLELVRILKQQMNETYVIAMWLLRAALDIFSHVILMVYLKFAVEVCHNEKCGYIRGVFFVPLFGNIIVSLYIRLIYTCSVSMDSAYCPEFKYVTQFKMYAILMEISQSKDGKHLPI